LVFDFVTDPEHVKKWKKGLVEIRRISSGPVGASTTEIHVGEFMGRRLEVSREITEYERDRKVRYRTTSGLFPAEGQLTFEDVEGGARLTVVSEAKPRGLFRVLVPTLQWVGKRKLKRDFAALKSVLEADY
jgi:hypothetical protein